MDPEGNEVSFPANGVEGHFTVLNFLDLSGYPEATHSLLYFPLKHSFVPFFFFFFEIGPLCETLSGLKLVTWTNAGLQFDLSYCLPPPHLSPSGTSLTPLWQE